MLSGHGTRRKALTIFATCCLFVMVVTLLLSGPAEHMLGGQVEVVANYDPTNVFDDYERSDYRNGRWRDFSDDEIGNLSTLARIMYMDEKLPNINQTKKYNILIWKHGKYLQNRHLKYFGNTYHDPFEGCSVKNCEMKYEDSDLKDADLVLFHMHRTTSVKELPPQSARNPDQIWTFLTDESPYHTFLHAKTNKMPDYNGVFNWTMTYRSDIPVPYGRTVLRKKPDESKVDDLKIWKSSKKSDVFIAILGSNCGSKNNRWEYVKALKKYIPVDIYGRCGTLKCPGHFNLDCESIKDYMFYLAFENSNCDEYLTEKVWWNAYYKKSIPIIMGAPESSLSKLLPPNSYINVENFASPRDLANYINYLMTSPSELQTYFQWKKYFEVLQEHAYFQTESYHYCRICEALNYNSKVPKVYENLDTFWSVKKQCHPSWDIKFD